MPTDRGRRGRLARRLTVGAAVILAMLVAITAVGSVGLWTIGGQVDRFVAGNDGALAAFEIERRALAMRRDIRALIAGTRAAATRVRNDGASLEHALAAARELVADAASATRVERLIALTRALVTAADQVAAAKRRHWTAETRRLANLGDAMLAATAAVIADAIDAGALVLAARIGQALSGFIDPKTTRAGAPAVDGTDDADGAAAARRAATRDRLAGFAAALAALEAAATAPWRDRLAVVAARVAAYRAALAPPAAPAHAPAVGTLSDLTDRLAAEAAALRSDAVASFSAVRADTDRVVRRMIGIVLAVAAVGLGFGAAAAWRLIDTIVTPLIRMTEAMRRLAAGDTVEQAHGPDRDDEIGEMAEALAVFRQTAITLAQQTRFQSTLLEAIAVPLFYKDVAGRYLGCNRAFEAFVGRPRAEIIGRRVEELWAPAHAAVFQDADRALFDDLAALPQIYETKVRNHRGEDRDVIFSKATFDDAGGRTAGLVGTFVDITDRRHVQELRAANDALAHLNRELEAFIYSVSHDLRAPLRAVDGFSAALVEDYGDRLDPGAHRFVTAIRDGAHDLRARIEGLLTMSRSARSELHRTPVDLSAIAHEIVAALTREQPDRQITCRIADGVTAKADPRLIRVVLENLIGNAWKYTAKTDDAVIEFGCEDTADGPVIFVKDNGAGFDMAYADKLFLPFQRLHTVGEFEGTGLGLATVQRIVHRHGGRVRAESTVGAGAVFRLTLDGGDPPVGPTDHGTGTTPKRDHDDAGAGAVGRRQSER